MGIGTRGVRVTGSRNRRTHAPLALAEQGETPCGFALRVMRDETQPPELRMHAAKLAAPHVHPRPQPKPRLVEALELEERIAALAEMQVRAKAEGRHLVVIGIVEPPPRELRHAEYQKPNREAGGHCAQPGGGAEHPDRAGAHHPGPHPALNPDGTPKVFIRRGVACRQGK